MGLLWIVQFDGLANLFNTKSTQIVVYMPILKYIKFKGRKILDRIWFISLMQMDSFFLDQSF